MKRINSSRVSGSGSIPGPFKRPDSVKWVFPDITIISGKLKHARHGGHVIVCCRHTQTVLHRSPDNISFLTYNRSSLFTDEASLFPPILSSIFLTTDSYRSRALAQISSRFSSSHFSDRNFTVISFLQMPKVFRFGELGIAPHSQRYPCG